MNGFQHTQLCDLAEQQHAHQGSVPDDLKERMGALAYKTGRVSCARRECVWEPILDVNGCDLAAGVRSMLQWQSIIPGPPVVSGSSAAASMTGER